MSDAKAIGADLRARLRGALAGESQPPGPQAPQGDNRARLDACEGPHRFAHAPGGTPPRTMRCDLCGGWADPYWVGGYELGRMHERREREGR